MVLRWKGPPRAALCVSGVVPPEISPASFRGAQATTNRRFTTLLLVPIGIHPCRQRTINLKHSMQWPRSTGCHRGRAGGTDIREARSPIRSSRSGAGRASAGMGKAPISGDCHTGTKTTGCLQGMRKMLASVCHHYQLTYRRWRPISHRWGLRHQCGSLFAEHPPD